MLIVVVGDVVNGFDMVGPFESDREIQDYMDLNYPDDAYTVVTVREP